MVDVSLTTNGNRFKSSVWVRRKAWNTRTMVHRQTIFTEESLPILRPFNEVDIPSSHLLWGNCPNDEHRREKDRV